MYWISWMEQKNQIHCGRYRLPFFLDWWIYRQFYELYAETFCMALKNGGLRQILAILSYFVIYFNSHPKAGSDSELNFN